VGSRPGRLPTIGIRYIMKKNSASGTGSTTP
jgi:hypothetical protein